MFAVLQTAQVEDELETSQSLSNSSIKLNQWPIHVKPCLKKIEIQPPTACCCLNIVLNLTEVAMCVYYVN